MGPTFSPRVEVWRGGLGSGPGRLQVVSVRRVGVGERFPEGTREKGREGCALVWGLVLVGHPQTRVDRRLGLRAGRLSERWPRSPLVPACLQVCAGVPGLGPATCARWSSRPPALGATPPFRHRLGTEGQIPEVFTDRPGRSTRRFCSHPAAPVWSRGRTRLPERLGWVISVPGRERDTGLGKPRRVPAPGPVLLLIPCLRFRCCWLSTETNKKDASV